MRSHDNAQDPFHYEGMGSGQDLGTKLDLFLNEEPSKYLHGVITSQYCFFREGGGRGGRINCNILVQFSVYSRYLREGKSTSGAYYLLDKISYRLVVC